MGEKRTPLERIEGSAEHRFGVLAARARSEPSPNLPTPCLIWTGRLNQWGYGRFTGSSRQNVLAHRFAWEQGTGTPIPKGLSVLHRCDVRACIEVSHLYLGTQRQNMRDAAERCRMPRGEKHHNAKLTKDNVRAIRVLRGQGASTSDLASTFGVKEGTIRSILDGSNWAWLD